MIPSAATGTTRLRWVMISLVFAATVINYIDRQTLSLAIPVIREQYGLTNTQYSYILNAFLVAYTIMQAISGRLVDWLGTRRGFAVFMSWWSAAGVLTALANSVPTFSVFRFLLGMGEAGNWPLAVKVIAEWFPARERALAAGFFNSGSSIGAVLAPPAISWIILRFGWRAAFAATGLIGIVWLAAWLAVYCSPEEQPRISAAELNLIRGDRIQAPAAVAWRWRDLFRHRQLWGLMLGRILSDPVWWFYVFWLPEYLKRQRDFSLAQIGLFAWIPFFTAGIGSFVGGGASSYLIRRGWTVGAARKTVLGASAAAMIAGIPAVFAASGATSVALISVATLAYASFASNVITLPTDVFPKEVVASVYGAAGTAAGIGGITFTALTGWVVDKFSYTPVFVAAGVLPAVAASVLIYVFGPVKPIPLAEVRR